MAIIDLYNAGKFPLSGVDYTKAGGKTPNVTDVIHNTKFGPEAVDGFTANEAVGDPTKFNMIDEDNILRYGFIAQEVQPVLNDFVTESSRAYKDGDYVIDNILTLESSGSAWAALLVEAIKEQQKQIEELKSEIEQLKNK